MSKSKTVLGSEYTATEAQKEEQEKINLDWGKFQILLDTLYEAYIEEQIKLENLCLWAVTIAKYFEGSVLPIIPEKGRDRMIGNLVVKAVSSKPPKVRITPPEPLQILIVQMVELAHMKDNYRLSRYTSENTTPGDTLDDSAFECIAALMRKMGVEISKRTIEKYWQKHQQHRKFP